MECVPTAALHTPIFWQIQENDNMIVASPHENTFYFYCNYLPKNT